MPFLTNILNIRDKAFCLLHLEIMLLELKRRAIHEFYEFHKGNNERGYNLFTRNNGQLVIGQDTNPKLRRIFTQSSVAFALHLGAGMRMSEHGLGDVMGRIFMTSYTPKAWVKKLECLAQTVGTKEKMLTGFLLAKWRTERALTAVPPPAGRNLDYKYRHHEWKTKVEPELNRTIEPQILDAVPGFAHMLNWDIGIAKCILMMAVAKMRDENWGNTETEWQDYEMALNMWMKTKLVKDSVVYLTHQDWDPDAENAAVDAEYTLNCKQRTRHDATCKAMKEAKRRRMS